MKTSLLNHSGPFNIINAFKQISPGETHSIKASFRPGKHDKYQEKLQIYSKNAKLELTLAGEGVFPSLKLDPDVQKFEFSNPVAKGDKAIQNFNVSLVTTIFLVRFYLFSVIFIKYFNIYKYFIAKS